MSTNKVWLVCLIQILAFAGLSLAQSAPGPIGQNFIVKPRSGQEMQWEAAYKEHLQWHQGIKDAWGWTTYQMMSGPDSGKYIVRTGGHEWKDFDERGDLEQKDAANYFGNAGKFTESYTIAFDRIHGNLSRAGEGPYKVLEFTTVKVKPGKVSDFVAVVGKFHAAFEKTNSPQHYVIAQTEMGGSASDFLFVGLHESYASLEPPPNAMEKMMEEVYGGMEAARIFDEFSECVDHMESNVAILREDLTYRPSSSSTSQ